MAMQQQYKIGLATATIMCMNAMIGAGIFTTPAKLALSVGPAGIITYVFVIVAVLFMALSLARVAELYPQEGSFYVYAKAWGGHTVGVLAAGAYVLGVLIALSLITQLAAGYLHAFFPEVSVNTIGVVLVGIIVGLNVVGVRFVQVGQIILLSCTLFALLATTVLGLAHARADNLVPFMPQGWSSLASAVPAAIFAFFGFESATSLFSMVKNPERTVPRALTYSILIVGAVYLAFIASVILAIPREEFINARMPLSEAIMKLFPQYSWLAKAIGIAIITAFLGVLQSMMYSVSALAFSFFKLLRNKYAQAITRAPYGFQALIVAVGLCVLLNFFALKSIDLFFNLTALCVVFAYASAIMVLVVNKHDKTTGQKVVTFLGLATAGVTFIIALMGLVQELGKSWI
jgi:basic amino acid/polyamine antiporter, APA family